MRYTASRCRSFDMKLTSDSQTRNRFTPGIRKGLGTHRLGLASRWISGLLEAQRQEGLRQQVPKTITWSYQLSLSR